MSGQAQAVTGEARRAIRGELRVLAVAVFSMLIAIFLSIASLLRLIGVPDLPAMQLMIYRMLDMLIVVTFLLYCRPRVKVRIEDLMLLIFVSYPFLIGLLRGSLSLTFLNDTAIFLAFVAKIVIFRTVLIRVSQVAQIDEVFRRSARRIIACSAGVALMSLVAATALIRGGVSFYYQAPVELTFAAALALAQGKMAIYLLLLVMALAAGKRMAMIGLLVMGLIAIIARPRVRAAVLRLALVALILTPVFIAITVGISGTSFVFWDKLTGTIQTVQRAMDGSSGFLEMLMLIDPGRYVEYVSLQPHLTGWSLWFGNGYGFRYELDSAFLQEFGYEVVDDVTNAHFTPLAIAAKFGIIGLAIWTFFIARFLTASIDRSSYIQYAARLAFISMVVQSFFAFGFFVSIFTPFYFAAATMGRRVAQHGIPGTLLR